MPFEAVGLDMDIRPYAGEKFVRGNQPARILRHISQKIEGLGPERHLKPAAILRLPHQAIVAAAELERSKTDYIPEEFDHIRPTPCSNSKIAETGAIEKTRRAIRCLGREDDRMPRLARTPAAVG